MRRSDAGQILRVRPVLRAMSSSSLLSRAASLAHHPVGDELRLPAAGPQRHPRSRRRLRASASASPRRRRRGRTSRSKRAFIARGSSGSSRLTRSIQSRRDHQRRQVGVGEVAVVVRVFLAAHRARLAAIGVEQHGRLLDAAAVLDRVDLPLHLVVDRLLQEAEGVQVLDLAPRAERLRPGGAPRRWRRSGSCLPACCRRRCRSSAPARAAPWRRRPPRPRSNACRAR